MIWKRGEKLPPIVVESSGYEGVRRIAGKVAEDFRLVLGETPEVAAEEILDGRGRISRTAEETLGGGGQTSETAGEILNGGGRTSETAEEILNGRGQMSGAASCRDGRIDLILCATLGKSPLLEELAAKGLVDLSGLYRTVENQSPAASDPQPKREVYLIKRLPGGLEGAGEILLVCGSDKRGTIYGLFALSEYIGVSPLCYWGDAAPAKRDAVPVGPDIEILSREPSVKYRGFFINDEWPCFGTWVNKQFGGFNAQAYDKVFELLLRMKGNYLWPAMWSASFPLDGPGSANEELADLYGVVMCYSHHEPCLRASEEWKKVCGPGSRYGSAWNFYTNEQGLLNYWEDSLKRSGKYENMITIGMRGEYDSCMLGPDATVTENVELLKRIITKQKELIGRYVKREGKEIPLLLALYKEVEAYFYGDEQTPGLKDWEGIEGVTCMLCEDNFGQMRTLPTEEIRNRRGGFGMYYHFDYHGGPISYEWVDSTPFSKIWEQMCQAYEYGIRDVWIVNVGDLKFHEVPLTYFMALAYDYDKWGYGNPRSYEEYTKEWVHRTFPEAGLAAEAEKLDAAQEAGLAAEAEKLDAAQEASEIVESGLQEKIGGLLTDYIALNALRRPEALHPEIYHPCHYEETDRMLALARDVEKRSLEVLAALEEQSRESAAAYYSMIHFPAMASMNLLKMHLYAGKNHHYARQGRPVANVYGKLTEDCIRRDGELIEEWATFLDGKWDGMQLAQHIGFTKWNEDDYRYPVVMEVEPAHRPRLSVSRKDEERTASKNYGAPTVISVPDFQDAGCTEVRLEVANTGRGSLHYQIRVEVVEPAEAAKRSEVAGQLGTADQTETEGSVEFVGRTVDRLAGLPAWLEVDPASGDVEELQEVTLRCRREKLPVSGERFARVRLILSDGDAAVAVEVLGRRTAADGLPAGTFLPAGGAIVMEASHFCRKKDTARGGFQVISGYGKYGSGVKVFPSTALFAEMEEKPELIYRFYLEEVGEYEAELIAAPTNSPVNHRSMNLMVQGRKTELLPADFKAGENSDARWCRGVLDQERRIAVKLHFEAGVQELCLGALEPGVVLERIIIHKAGRELPKSYLGPRESVRL